MSNSDFEEFCQEKTDGVPDHVSQNIIDHVNKDLNPNTPLVICKLITIQGAIGLLTMLFCPQFDLSFTSNHEVYHFFHRHFGLYGCMAICGALFMGSGAILAGLILRFSELDLILSSKYLLNFSLSGVAIAFFLIFGAEIYLGISFFWILGGTIASILALNGGRVFRTLLLQQNYGV